MRTSQIPQPGGSQGQALAVRFLYPDRAIPRKKMQSAAFEYPQFIESRRISAVAVARHLPRFPSRLKRAIDIICSAIGLLLLSPFLALIAVLIKLDSSGPVLYCAPRAGKQGCSFICYKFRTMINDADLIKMTLRSKNERKGAFF